MTHSVSAESSSVSAPRRPRPAPASAVPSRDLIPPPTGMTPAPDGWGQVEFLTEPGSPFPDGYSIAREEEALSDLFAMDHPDKDPRWPRMALLIDRKEKLERGRLEFRLEQGADKAVPHADANKLVALGSLVNEGEDSMALHTKEAFRLFMGRRQDPDKKYQPIIGAMRCASAMRGFWAQSANDNPYADWALLRAVQGLRQFSTEIKQSTERLLGKLHELESKGLSFTVLRSAEPQTVALKFKSPYGYLIAELTVDFDYLVRVIKTAVRKGRLTDAQGYDAIRDLSRRLRGWMEELARFNRFLWREELLKLSRADFLPGADAQAAKRVQAVTAIFGPVPPDIFSGRIVPPYTKRRTHVTDTERALLERVGQELAAADAQPPVESETAVENLL